MSTAFDVRALASHVRIELDDSLSTAEQESIKAHWADLAHDGSGEPDRVLRAGVRDDADPVNGVYTVSANSSEALAQRIASQVTLEAIGGLRGEALMFHAAAVALDDGRVIGFVGPSGRGKTTAAQELGRVYGYVTDETLAVRTDGSVLAYPKPLSIGSKSAVKATERASTLGLREMPRDTLHLAALVLLDRRPDAAEPFVESVPIIEAISELVPQVSHLSALDRPLRILIGTILSTGGVRRIVYSEATSLPSLVDDLLRTVDETAPVLMDASNLSRRDCDCAGKVLEKESTVDRPGAYWRGAFVDAMLLDDSLIVLASGRLTVLAGVGPAIWLAADGLTEEELKEAAQRDLPAPPADVVVDEVISDALQSLETAGLVVRT